MNGHRRHKKIINMYKLFLLADGATSAQDLSIFNPASPPAESIRSLFILVLAVTAAIFLLVEGVLLYSIVRFRRAPPEGKEPPQVYGSMPIEIVLWQVPHFLAIAWIHRADYGRAGLCMLPSVDSEGARPAGK